jgi:hypothetical protein
MQITTYQAGQSGAANAAKPKGTSAAEGIRRALIRSRGAAYVARMDKEIAARDAAAKAEAKAKAKAKAAQLPAPKPQPEPAAKLDFSPLAKAMADQVRLTGEAPAFAKALAARPAVSAPPAPAVDHAAARASWDQARAEMLQRTGRA